VNADHTTLALASTLSIFLMLFAVFICILVLREFLALFFSYTLTGYMQ